MPYNIYRPFDPKCIGCTVLSPNFLNYLKYIHCAAEIVCLRWDLCPVPQHVPELWRGSVSPLAHLLQASSCWSDTSRGAAEQGLRLHGALSSEGFALAVWDWTDGQSRKKREKSSSGGKHSIQTGGCGIVLKIFCYIFNLKRKLWEA